MRISAGTVTFGVVAILLGLVAAFIAKRALEQRPAPAPAVAQGSPIVVPRVNIPAGTLINMRDLQASRVPPETVPAGAVRAPAIAADRYAKQTLVAGYPVVESSLYAIGEGPSLADQLDPGYRALTINVSGVNAGSEFLKPGSVVDIALTVQQSLEDLEHGIGTVTLLENVKLMTGVAQGDTRRDGIGMSSATVTVAVTPEQANKLILAQRYGTMSVVLRNSADALAGSEDSRTMIEPRSILNLPPRPATVAPYRVEQWIGGQRQVLELSPDLVREAEEATAADTRRRTDLTTQLPNSSGGQNSGGMRTRGVSAPVHRPAIDRQGAARPASDVLRSTASDRLRDSLRRSPPPQITYTPAKTAPAGQQPGAHPIARQSVAQPSAAAPVPSPLRSQASSPIANAAASQPAVETLPSRPRGTWQLKNLPTQGGSLEPSSVATERPTTAPLATPQSTDSAGSGSLQSRALERLYATDSGLSDARPDTSTVAQPAPQAQARQRLQPVPGSWTPVDLPAPSQSGAQ